jgi:glycine/D-amino acid oxidase-like deaminating enzyme
MDLKSDFSFWPIQNGLVASYPGLDRDLICEVVIVGGGITGALIAYHLCAAGIETVLLDKRNIGTGSTSASTGLLQYELDMPLSQLVAQIGKKDAERSYRLCGDAIEKIARLTEELEDDCGFERKRSLFLARHPRDIPRLRSEYALRRQCGIRLAFLNRAEIESRFSFSRPAALYSEQGGQIDPHRLTHALLKAGCYRGLKVFDRTKMNRFVLSPNRMTLMTNRGCRIQARRLVLAAGYEAQLYLEQRIGKLKSTYALISEPVQSFPGWHQRCLIWERATPYLYLRTTQDSRIIVGGEDEDFYSPERRDALIEQKTKVLVRKFQRMFPQIKLEVAYSWAGTFAETKDGLAYIGTTRELPLTYLAMGYGGNGITFSVIAAEIIRDDFLGRPCADARIFGFDR